MRSENCIVRGSVALVIWPKFGGGLFAKLPEFTPKYDKWLGASYPSMRMYHWNRSPTGNDFVTDAFQLFIHGPTIANEPRFPNVPAFGTANAFGLRNWRPSV